MHLHRKRRPKLPIHAKTKRIVIQNSSRWLNFIKFCSPVDDELKWFGNSKRYCFFFRKCIINENCNRLLCPFCTINVMCFCTSSFRFCVRSKRCVLFFISVFFGSGKYNWSDFGKNSLKNVWFDIESLFFHCGWIKVRETTTPHTFNSNPTISLNTEIHNKSVYRRFLCVSEIIFYQNKSSLFLRNWI